MKRSHALALVVALVAIAVLPNFLKSYGVYLMTLFCVYLMATMGLNLTVGYAGQMSLGHAAFFGIGAYHAAILLKLGWPFLAVLPVAALACFIVGLALGFPALRVQHHYLAFATLGFNVLVYLVMRNEEKVTGGTFGISGIPRPSLFGYSLDGSLAFFYFTFVSVLVLGLVLWWLLRSPWGRAFAALRDNPIRAESLGINITAYTLLAFAIGAACAGIGGVYFAALVQFIEPAPFHVSASLTMLLAIIVGGSGRFFGPVLGTVVVVLLPEWLRFMQNWYLAVFGFAVVALMIWLPGGLLSIPERFAKGADEMTAAREISRSEGHAQGLRRDQGRRRRHDVGGPRRDRRRDRTERLGQDDALQQHPGPDQADLGRGRVLRRGRHRHVAARVVAARRRAHLPDAAGLRQAVGARQPDRRRAGVQGLAARPAAGEARCRPRAPRRRDDRALPAEARRGRARRNAVLRPAKAHRHRDGVHGRAAARAAGRALRRRQSEPRRPAARAPGPIEQDARAAASSSSSTTWIS